MILYLLIGFLLASLGTTIIDNLCIILNNLTELLKAKIAVSIMKCNAIIDELQSKPDSDLKIIGFTTTTSEKDENKE